MSSNTNVSILIEAKDKASSTIAKVSDAVEKVGKTGNGTAIQLEGMSSRGDKSFGLLSRSGLIAATTIGNVFAQTFAAVSSSISNSISSAISRVDTLNNFPKVMSNFGVSAADATMMITTLDKGVRGLPTSLNSIASLAQGFVPLTKNTEEATKTALALNNAIIAGGTPAYEQAAAMEQFRQALSKGVPDLQDWKSVEMAMPAQLQQIAIQLGIGSGALKGYTKNGLGVYQSMKDGKLTMDDFNQALISLNQNGINGLPNFATQAKNASNGIQTSFTNMQNAVNRSIAKVVNTIGSSNISAAVTGIGAAFEATGGFISSAIKTVQDFGSKALDYLSPKFSGLWDVVWTKLIPALGIFWHNYIEPLIPVIGTVLVGAIGLVIDGLNLAATAITWLATGITNGDPIIWGLIGVLGTLAGAAGVAGVISVVTTLTTVTIPGLMTAFGGMAALVAIPIIMPAIAIGAALAAIAAVSVAWNNLQNQIASNSKNIQDAVKAGGNAEATLRAILNNPNSSAAEKARAAQSLKAVQANNNNFINYGSTNALGTNYATGGSTLVGEHGPEIVNLPRGSQVTPAYRTRSDASSGAGTTNNYLTGNFTFSTAESVKEFFGQLDKTQRLARMGLAA